MVIKRRRPATFPRFFILPLFCLALVCLYPVAAQDAVFYAGEDESALESAERAEYYVEYGEDGARFVQTLSWSPLEYVFRYEVFIERDYPIGHIDCPEGGWRRIYSASTEDSSVQVSLAAGDYRYMIAVYDLLDMPAGESEWRTFTIFKAYQPEADRFSPEKIYLDDDAARRVRIYGKNFEDGMRVYIARKSKARNQSGGEESSRNGDLGSSLIIGAENVVISRRGEAADVYFKETSLATGDYTIVLENPGGLTARLEPFSIRFLDPVDFTLAAGYSPMICSMGDAIDEYFDSSFFPMAVSLRMELIPFKRAYGYWGIGLLCIGGRMQAVKEKYTLSSYTGSAFLNALFQKPLASKKIRLNFRLGAGVSSFLKMQFDFDGLKSPELNTWMLSCDAGVSVSFYLLKRLYLEAGADYFHCFSSGLFHGFAVPSVSIGWLF